MVTFRKNKSGEWVVFGPVSEVVVGKVWATRKDGRRRPVDVTGLGRPFSANGEMCVYGYIGTSRPPAEDAPAPAPAPVQEEMSYGEDSSSSYDAADVY